MSDQQALVQGSQYWLILSVAAWATPIREQLGRITQLHGAQRTGIEQRRTEPSLILNGCRCSPKRFLESGFEYQFPDLRGALKNSCR